MEARVRRDDLREQLRQNDLLGEILRADHDSPLPACAAAGEQEQQAAQDNRHPTRLRKNPPAQFRAWR